MYVIVNIYIYIYIMICVCTISKFPLEESLDIKCTPVLVCTATSLNNGLCCSEVMLRSVCTCTGMPPGNS